MFFVDQAVASRQRREEPFKKNLIILYHEGKYVAFKICLLVYF